MCERKEERAAEWTKIVCGGDKDMPVNDDIDEMWMEVDKMERKKVKVKRSNRLRSWFTEGP